MKSDVPNSQSGVLKLLQNVTISYNIFVSLMTMSRSIQNFANEIQILLVTLHGKKVKVIIMIISILVIVDILQCEMNPPFTIYVIAQNFECFSSMIYLSNILYQKYKDPNLK